MVRRCTYGLRTAFNGCAWDPRPVPWRGASGIAPRRARALDWAIAVGFTVAVVLITRKIQDPDDPGRLLNWLGYACILFAGLPLGFRRRAPLTVLAVTTVAAIVYTGFHYPGGPVYLGPIVAMYTVGAAYPRRQWGFYVGFSAGCISSAGILHAEEAGIAWFHAVYFTWCIAAGFIGDVARSRRDYFLGLEERARFLEESREEESRRLVAEERLRIARDLHDVVAHSLASINIQAGAGAHVAAAHPDQAAAALTAIKGASKEALDELRVDARRAPHGRRIGAARAPVPSLARLDALVARTQQAGLPVEVVVRAGRAARGGRRSGVPDRPGIVDQRAPPRRARRRRDRPPRLPRRRAGDRGVGRRARLDRLNTNPGHGIAGMRERAVGLGGTLSPGPSRAAGSACEPVLPTRAEVSS